MNPTRIPRIQLVAAALLFSTGGAAIKACGLSSFDISGLRSLLAAAVLLVFLPETRRGYGWRFLPVAFVHAATLITFVAANRLTTGANVTFLANTAPLYVLPLGAWLLKEEFRRRDLLTITLLGLGVTALVTGTDDQSGTATNPPLGNLLATVNGFTWALTLIGLRWLGRTQEGQPSAAGVSARAVVVGNLVTFLVCIPFMGAERPLTEATLVDVLTIAYLGMFQITLAYVLLTRGLARRPAFEAAVLLLLEPVASPFWAWLFHDEVVSVNAWVGGALIVFAVLLHSRRRRR